MRNDECGMMNPRFSSLPSHLFYLLLILCSAAASAETGRYTVDPAASDIHWRVYRAGLLAGLGHNHVISTGGFSGSVQLADAPQASLFELVIPVTALVVDDPAMRRRYGGDFSDQPSTQAIAGTRANMLGGSLLNAGSYPRIRLSGSAVVAAGKREQDLLLDAEMELVGQSIPIRLPARVTLNGDELLASGQFTLSHRQLGLTPFSAAMGALKVAQKIDFTYDIHARRAD